MWNLAAVARCPTLQSFLSPDEQQSVSGVLCTTPGEDDAPPSLDAAALSVDRPDASAASLPPDEGANGGFPTSAHLERHVLHPWRTWKLADEHIEQLTSTTDDAGDAMRALEQRVRGPLRFFARGKRGVLYAGELPGDAEEPKPVVAKLAAAGAEAQRSVVSEAKWLRVMNRMGVGAALVDAGPGWFLQERLEGKNVVDFLGQSDALVSRADALWVVREMLSQCFTMDLMSVNKEEMTHPHRHIIVSRKTGAGSTGRWRCTFVDFEKCAHTMKPKNVTQLCQFLSSPRMVALLQAKRVRVDVPRLRQCTKRYKQALDSRALDAIMSVFAV